MAIRKCVKRKNINLNILSYEMKERLSMAKWMLNKPTLQNLAMCAALGNRCFLLILISFHTNRFLKTTDDQKTAPGRCLAGKVVFARRTHRSTSWTHMATERRPGTSVCFLSHLGFSAERLFKTNESSKLNQFCC